MSGAIKSISIDTVELVDGVHSQLDACFPTRREAEAFNTELHSFVLELVRRMGGNIIRNDVETRRIILPG